MGRFCAEYLHSSVNEFYTCRACHVQLVAKDNLVSKAFQGRHGKAYLFQDVINYSVGPEENRMLITGLHTVRDIFCDACHEPLGWMYEKAFEQSQKYKEGKFIIERIKMDFKTRPSVADLLKNSSSSSSADADVSHMESFISLLEPSMHWSSPEDDDDDS